jgi:hypothetical protein
LSPDEQAALSIRYIAPRVVLLDSGLYALIDMQGDNPPAILSGDALLYAIPTEAELSAEYSKGLTSKRAPKPSTLSLEDLGL